MREMRKTFLIRGFYQLYYLSIKYEDSYLTTPTPSPPPSKPVIPLFPHRNLRPHLLKRDRQRRDSGTSGLLHQSGQLR